jgi:hypothetical protein
MSRTLLALLILGPTLAVADATTEACRACHKDALSLQGKDAGAMAARMRAMRDGRERHPAPIPKLADTEIAALARELTAL